MRAPAFISRRRPPNRWPWLKSAVGRYGFAIRLLGLRLRRDLLVVDVHGRSMQPALRDGDRLLCSRRAVRRENAIVVRDTKSASLRNYQIKRLVALAGGQRGGNIIGPGDCWIEGDNKQESGDSRAFGPIRFSELIAVGVGLVRDGHVYALSRPRNRRHWQFVSHIRELWGDLRHRVRTRGAASAESFGFSGYVARRSMPTPWNVIHRAFDALEIDASDVLLDYGCGKGRVLAAASSYPFRRIIGIDIVPQLVEIARVNVAADSRCHVCCVDAGEFIVPDDVTIVYLFNPFGDVTHQQVGERVAESLRRRSRQIQVLAYHTRAEWLASAASSQELGRGLVVFQLRGGV